ncbi:2Fe-2S iron-sulfur cluster-binding protein [Acinetobacter sp. TGL-Y2]|uniref:2Fe-2S iron-sulfur cluster-binding protein n=1 Tax=Acinetobacter sp. TGL-Y2 TaxID=1407071 RepID=UPI001BB32438|nr:2Fe-2S iron-sulfur cluster-binding protein [Acinetobacter sp. TGL-Y2]
MHKILLISQNIEVSISQDRSLSDLEFEEQGQNPIPFGCKAGACGICVTEILEGA